MPKPYMKKKMVAEPVNELKAAAGPNCTRPTKRATKIERTIPHTGSPRTQIVRRWPYGNIPSRPNAKRAREAEMVFPRVALEKTIRMIKRNTVVQALDPVASITS